MLNVLINAYAVGPNRGSEPGMGWNWCVNLAHHCRLFVITEGEFRDEIEQALAQTDVADRISFYYLPVSERVRCMCWNQGDWRFYYHYRRWQKRALELAKEIMQTERIDVVHQLNMVGFREPGFLWKIADVPFVWGPFGGMDNAPAAFLKGCSLKIKTFTWLKRNINNFQIRHHRRVRKAVRRADILIGATKASVENVRRWHGKDALLISETGCDDAFATEKTFSPEGEFSLVWVGKFDFRKRLDLALKTIARLDNLPGLQLHICGDGTPSQRAHYQQLARELGISSRCVWHGQLPHAEVQALMRRSDLFLFTSIMESTSTVVMEAIANRLPIVCFNLCGFGPIVTEAIGRRVEATTPEESVAEFAGQIAALYHDRATLRSLSHACAEAQKALTWKAKARQVAALYEMTMGDKHGR